MGEGPSTQPISRRGSSKKAAENGDYLKNLVLLSEKRTADRKKKRILPEYKNDRLVQSYGHRHV